MIKKISSNKNIIISHIADIDGMGSVILANKFYNNQIDYILSDIDELPDLFNSFDFTNYETIYLCDLPLLNCTITILNHRPDLTRKLKHFDHHLCYEQEKTAYVNAFSVLNNRLSCGTELFYNYLLTLNSSLNNPFYQTLVEATREQDTWDFQEESYNAKLLASIHALIGPTAYIDLISSLDDQKPFQLPRYFNDLYKQDLERQQAYLTQVNQNLLITTYKNYQIGVTIAEQYRSIIGAGICQLHPELAFVMILNYNRNKVSLRSAKAEIDLNQIAAEFHPEGGGHKNAAGFIIDDKSIPNIQKYHQLYLENLKSKY